MKFKLIIAVASLALLNSCTAIDPAVRLTYAISGLSQDDDETGTGELSGTWNGNWTSNSTNKEGLINANFSHTESILSGTFSLENSPCMDSGNIYGTVSDNKVNMLIRSGNNTFKIDTFRNPDSSISGIYNITKGECKGSSGKVLLTQTNQTYKAKEQVSKVKGDTSNILSDAWDNLNTQAGQNSWDTKLYRLGEALSNMGTPYSQRGVSPSYRWMADEPDSGFSYSDYNRMSEQNKTDRKIKELEKQVKDSTFGYMSGNQMYSKSNKYMGYIKSSNLYNEHGQKTGYIRGNSIYSNSGKYLGYTR